MPTTPDAIAGRHMHGVDRSFRPVFVVITTPGISVGCLQERR